MSSVTSNPESSGQNAPLAGSDVSQSDVSPAKDSNDTLRIISMIGVIACGFFQVFTLADGDVLCLAAVGSLLAWFFLARHIAPLYLLFIGDMVFRLAKIASFRSSAFRDLRTEEFLFHMFDSITFVGIMALGFIYYELVPTRLSADWQSEKQENKRWHLFEPFSGLAVRLPIAVACALLVYFMSGQIQSPIEPRLLAARFAQAYLVVLTMLAVFLLLRTLLELWSWRKLKPDHASFYVSNQISLELLHELDQIRKPGWSRIDHASAAGGMFLLQWIIAMIMSLMLIVNARLSGNAFMWPAVAALFVFLTSAYNAIRAARSNISAEQHIITVVGFLVVTVVGFQSFSMPLWPWRMLYHAWWCFNAVVIIRLCYLWLLDEHYARKNGWENARPFSWIRMLLVLAEGALAAYFLFAVSIEILRVIQ